MLAIDLTGKVALVTGATGDLGAAIVHTLAMAGADTAIAYFHNKRRARQLLQEVREHQRRAMIAQVDVTDIRSVLAMRDTVSHELGPVDVVVTSAVTKYEWRTVLEQPPEDYLRQFRANVLQNVYVSKAFLPSMIKRRWGRFIGINSECTMQCWVSQSAYVAGKRGMDGLLRVLAREVGEFGITVNQVAPGWFVSKEQPLPDSDLDAWYTDKVPLRRRGSVQEIANVIAFLSSDMAGFISGAFVPVCGGNIMPGV